ncbi:DPM3 [Branchiostoma lanceolatum]|uniref:Dolichol-phosphate mannosyltransferase subunit 3 n=1 Tax=Branchiostoma lanceolatum TaxID=7740 RepID=A0A8K0A068_BRALA|nr:DPM3 [Branchiostoma lanceolatum]
MILHVLYTPVASCDDKVAAVAVGGGAPPGYVGMSGVGPGANTTHTAVEGGRLGARNITFMFLALFSPQAPMYLLMTFACYSLATIGYRVATFNDCEDAAKELQQEIEEARRDLMKKGLKFS